MPPSLLEKKLIFYLPPRAFATFPYPLRCDLTHFHSALPLPESAPLALVPPKATSGDVCVKTGSWHPAERREAQHDVMQMSHAMCPPASAIVLLHRRTPSLGSPHRGLAGIPSLLQWLKWLLGFLCTCLLWNRELFQFLNFTSVGCLSPSFHSSLVKSCPD